MLTILLQAGKMEVCKDQEILKRQITIFREVSDDLASRLEKATGIKGYAGIADIRFNGTHNGMKKSDILATGLKARTAGYNAENPNGAPIPSSHDGIAAH
jgi:catalase